MGGGDGDLLIGGTTDYDADAAARLAILAEWARKDGIHDDYAARVGHLKNGGGKSIPGDILLFQGARRAVPYTA